MKYIRGCVVDVLHKGKESTRRRTNASRMTNVDADKIKVPYRIDQIETYPQ